MMVMLFLFIVMMVAVPAVSASFRLECSAQSYEIRSEAAEHSFNYMVGPDPQKAVTNLRRQMAISQMPCEANKLMRILVPYFDNIFGCGLNSQPTAIFKLQTISIGHGNCLRQIEQNIFSLIGTQANTTAMA